jgi:hypothetical protein
MHFAKQSVLLAFAALAFAAPFEKRDYVSDGVLVIETTVIETVTQYANVAAPTGSPSLTIPFFNSTSSNSTKAHGGRKHGSKSHHKHGSQSAMPLAAAATTPINLPAAVSSPSGFVPSLPSAVSAPDSAPTVPAAAPVPAPDSAPTQPATVPSAAAPTLPAAPSSSSPASAPAAVVAAVPAPAGGLTAAQIISISPGTSSCAGAQYPDECHTAAQMAGPFADSFAKYGISNTAAQAAALSLALFESDGFIYNVKHFPVTPGQGTADMMSAQFNRQYATSLFGASAVASLSDDDMLKLVTPLPYTAGSAAWFMSTICGPSLIANFASDSTSAWTAYHACIGTTLTPERTAIFTTAKKVLGVTS